MLSLFLCIQAIAKDSKRQQHVTRYLYVSTTPQLASLGSFTNVRFSFSREPSKSKTDNFKSRAPTSITVHPSVVASILTHHTRRNASHRVIGTLLGLRSETGAEIEVRTAFAVPHSENESQCAVDMAFQQGMADLLARGQGGKGEGKEVVVGW